MPIVINAKIQANPATQALAKLNAALQEINKSVADLNDLLKDTAHLAGQASASMSSMARNTRGTGGRSSSGSFGGKKPPYAYANDPFTGMKNTAAAAAAGDPDAIRHFARYSSAYSRQQRGQAQAKNFQKAGGNRFGAMAADIFNRTRFANIGGKIIGMPLGIDVTRMGGGSILGGAMAGGEAIAGAGAGLATAGAGVLPVLAPLAVAVGVLVVEFKLLSDLVKATNGALGQWKSSYIMGGGTPGQARAASVISEALGVDIGGVGKNLMSGYGPIAAAQAGVNPFGGPFGDNDYNAKGLKLFDSIRASGSFNQARRRAEMMNAPEMAEAYLYSPGVAKALRDSTAGQATPKAMGAQADFNASLVIAKNAFNDIVVSLGTPMLKASAAAFTRIGDSLRGVNWDRLGNIFSSIIEQWEWLARVFAKLAHINLDLGEHAKAVKDNTRALNGLGSQIASQQGTYGGGARAQSMPSKLSPVFHHHYQQAKLGVL